MLKIELDVTFTKTFNYSMKKELYTLIIQAILY